MKRTAKDVAYAIIYNYILKQKKNNIPDEMLEYPTHLKLQKLLYFTQAAFLSVFGKDNPAFNEEIEAWEYGPVVKEVYYEFKKYKNKPIDDITEKELKKAYDKFTDEEKDIVSFINEVFGKYSASKLVDLTHQHKPWKQAFERGKKVISKDEIYNYYKDLFEYELD